MKPSEVRIEIDRLVLHGFPAHQRQAIGAALERELARLFVEQGVPAAVLAGEGAPCLDAGAVQARPGDRPEAVGTEVARAIYGGWKR